MSPYLLGRRVSRALFLRVLLALAVAAALLGAWAMRGPSGPSYPKVWDSRVLEIVHFVEKERGLTFKHPANVAFLSDKAFAAKVKDPEPTAKERREIQEALEELRAVGLVSGNPDLFAATNDLVTADVVGLYVPEDKTLYVRGTTLTPYARATAAHELTHALQDQYFDLDSLTDDAAGGDTTAVDALIEGDAVRIGDAYQKQLSDADQEAFEKEESKLQDSSDSSTADVPQVLKDLLALPYSLGPVYLDYLVASGGNHEVDRAFHEPPAVDAQILDPDTYPVGWKPKHLGHLALPDGAKALDEEQPFGQVWLFDVLGARLGYTKAWAAVQGWQGDVARPYRVNGRTCLGVDVAMSDDAAAARLTSALQSWARFGETVSTSKEKVSLRACDPGSKAAAVPHPSPSAFDVLSARAALINVLMTEGDVSFVRSQCVTDGVIDDLGIKLFAAAMASDEAADEGRMRAAFTKAAGACQAGS